MSFTLAGVLPRRRAYRVGYGTQGQMPPGAKHASFTARTTRVSNPVCYPRFRAAASMIPQLAAFASGVLPDIYAFHRSTGNSASLWNIQAPQSRAQGWGWAPALHARLAGQPTLPLRPVIPNNARTPRITAAAGTKFAGASSRGTLNATEIASCSPTTVVYTPRRSFPHVASLRQASAHCAIFPAAASRRSLGRISVPMWPFALSGRLPIVGLVGRYPANCLIGRELIPRR